MAFLRYLLGAAVAGTVGGAAHGFLRGWRELRTDLAGSAPTPTHLIEYMSEPVIMDSATGGLLAPWAPIAIPLWFFVWKGNKCPMRNRLNDHLQPE